MNSYILCSPQHAFLGVIGLLVCGLFTASAMESSREGTESLTAQHMSVDGSSARTLALAETSRGYR